MKDKYTEGYKWLGAYQVAGGLGGIALAIPMFSTLAQFDGSQLIMFFAGILLMLYSVYCGIELFRAQRQSMEKSFICQCLQILYVWGIGFTYQYAAGVAVYLGFSSSKNFQINFNGSLSGFSFAIEPASESRVVLFNLVAVAIAFFLNHEMKANKVDRRREIIKSFGDDTHTSTPE